MARGVNKVILLGNCGKDPELRYSAAGAAIASFSIATSESWTDKKTNEKQERTEWHNCTAFNRTAEIIGEYVKKGSQVYVEGQIRTEKYQDKKTGEDRYSTKIIVNNLQLLGTRNNTQQRDQTGGGTTHRAPAGGAEFDDDIPFDLFMRGEI